MNSGLFRLVFSRHLAMFVPVSEEAVAHGRKSSDKRKRTRNALAAAFSLAAANAAYAAPLANALPTAGVISSGSGSISTSGSAMTVTQNTGKMIVNWGAFNIGSGASVNFDQLNSSSAVLNRVSSTGGLSEIYGRLTANGQVFLINPNGILFGNGATVNVHSLVASSLNVTDDLFNKGIVSQTDGSAAFAGTTGFVQVDAGATLTADSGGKIMLFAPTVTNNGLIQTPDGQTLLAAGQKVYLATSGEPNMRGLLVEVDNGGAATNLGQIVAERGNVTLAGIAVNQSGRITATTSVTANGSIKLQARDTTVVQTEHLPYTRHATAGGIVTLGEGSTTEVLPETSDKTTMLDSTQLQNSFVDISGSNIHFQKDAWVVAPGGDVSLYAGLNPSVRTISSGDYAVANGSRIYFDGGSGIDVSGVGSGSTAADRAGETAAQRSVSSNIVAAQLLGSELRDAPLQRNGILYKSKVYVDSRVTGPDGSVGTSIADVSGYTSQIGHTVSERLAKGGSVKVQSEGDVVFNPGATINVSGGKVDYAGGSVTTTMLMASNGQVYDIAHAPKDLTYVSTKNVSYQEQGYTEGKDAGSVTFSAPAMVLQGKVKGDVTAGIHQRTAAARPQGATLQIGQNSVIADGALKDMMYTNVLHSDIVFDASSGSAAAPGYTEALSADQQQTLHLGRDFYAPSGFSNLKYYADGQITMEKGSNLQTNPGGSIVLNGGGIDVQGNLVAHGGTISLASKLTGYGSLYGSNGTTNIKVCSSSALDVSGLWTNDMLNSGATDAVVLGGGKINLSASGLQAHGSGDVILDSGSSLNASGGAWLGSAGTLSSGNGGAIALKASGGYDDGMAHSGKLVLNGTLRADSLATGGSLSLTSGSVTIGSVARGTNGELLIDPALFRNGGFTSYGINGYESLMLSANTAIAPATQTRILDRSYILQGSGTDITSFSHLTMLPTGGMGATRKATNLSMTASTETTGVLTLDQGSSISADPGAAVSLTAMRQLTALGSISAPAGRITMTLSDDKGATVSELVHYLNNQPLWLGANSVLDVSGVANVYNNAYGQRTGAVMDAGSIVLDAKKGTVVAEQGAVLNLKGADATLDLKQGNMIAAKDVASRGGSLSISAREGVLFDAAMDAHGGNSSVAAGSFSLSLSKPIVERLYNDGLQTTDKYPTGLREIQLRASGSAVPSGLRTGDPMDAANNGIAYVFADKLANAGFDSVTLTSRDNIRMAENVVLTTRGAITLDAPNVYVDNGVHAVLNSSYAGIGNSQADYQGSSNVAVPVAGSGSLEVNARYIDLFGNQNLSGAQNAVFTSSGDIQLRGVLPSGKSVLAPSGSLQTAGDLTFNAARIYPSTLSTYTIRSNGADATVTFARNGSDTGVPYSALGTLNVEAANIVQGGVLRAPFGVISLRASNQLTLSDGSLTSVSAEGKTLPFGTTINGTSWTYDFGDRSLTLSTLPDKAVNLSGNSINAASGSKVDVSGGGDLQAWEFTTGTGGTNDVLAANGVFAVLPGLTGAYMPGNSQSYGNGGLNPGDMIYLSGGNGLAAGNYVLLPAHYALMPGAYSVRAVSGKQDMLSQQNTANADGSMLMSGYRLQYGGLAADARTSGFVVASGSVARTQSEFTDTLASKFFKAAYADAQLTGYRLPADAGRLAISAANNLALDGIVAMNHASTARGAEVDISSSNIAISGDSSTETGYLTLSSNKLNAMGAESLMIGGTRTGTNAGAQFDVTASNVKLIGGASLSGQEIILAAADTVSMAGGTSVKGAGTAPVNNSALIIGSDSNPGSGDGALLHVSAGGQRDLVRHGTSQANGTLDVRTGATIAATGSIIADATYSNSLNGSVALANGGALRLGASRISFGAPGAPVSGLLFDNNKLTALGKPANLYLKSYSTLDFYGDVALGNNRLKSLTLESAGLTGYGNGVVSLTAGTVGFANPDGAAFSPIGTPGSGTLAVNAKQVDIGVNTFHTAGFDSVALTADQVTGKGTGGLDVTGNLSIDAGRITTASLADQTISATGSLQTSKHDVNGIGNAALGGKLTMSADTIIHGGIIDMPAGVVTLNASGAAGNDRLILQSGSQINDNGSAQTLGAAVALVDGGQVNLKTTGGDIRMDGGAVIDVSATGGASAGTLSIASAGTANLNGTLKGGAASGNGVASPKRGSFQLKAAMLTNFSALNALLENGSFNQSRNIHVAQGDINVAAADTVTAHNVTLTTDDGDMTVAGKIDASGDKGGIVNLNAGQVAGDGKGNLTLASTAVINASATTAATESAGSSGDGGKVILSAATDSVTSPVSGSYIDAASGSMINVSGKGLGSDGMVVLRAPRLGVSSAKAAGTGIAINRFESSVIGDNAAIVAEGVKVYSSAADLTMNSTYINTIKSNNTSFLSNANAISTKLGWSSDNRFSVIAGDEVRSAGNITVANGMHLQPWGPGALTLRAAGDINVNANISAGFSSATSTGVLSSSGGAWTYRMTSGADLSSADTMATNDNSTGDFTLAAGKLIRTGTGDINIASGGSFNLGSSDSAIYSAGTPDTKDYRSYGSFRNPTDKVGTTTYTAAYPVNGGAIAIAAKGDINGAYSGQLPADWLFRQGGVSNSTGLYTKKISWWPFFAYFKENIGALGGGDVNIAAGGAINDLSAVIATNGRVFGSSPATGTLIVNGGGDLTVQAGKHISGGLFMVDKGVATIRAGGGLIAGSGGNNTAFALGDGKINVAALGQLDVMTVFNPMLTGMAAINKTTQGSSYFSTYGSDSAVTLTSLAGGVGITSNIDNLPNDLSWSSTGTDYLHLFPGTLRATALGGDLAVGGAMAMAPAPNGDLQLAASAALNFKNSAYLAMSDMDPAIIPSALAPVSTTALIKNLLTSTYEGTTYHAATPVHQNDSSPVVIYAGSDIAGTSSSPSLVLPKKANVTAGHDIKDLWIAGQNLNNSDVSTITAGHDFIYGNALGSDGTFTYSGSGIIWGGPGYLNLTAGRNINLSNAYGIVTRGNLLNPALPEQGASLSVLAGANGADDSGFIAKYLDPQKNSVYSSDLTKFIKTVTGNEGSTDVQAWAAFQTLDASLKHQFVQQTFFNELKAAGIEHNDSKSANYGSYQRGYDAIATLYPDGGYNGNVDLSFSQIKTERGGDLNIMAPGGNIVVGLPKIPPSLIQSKDDPVTPYDDSPSKLGIFTVKGGNVNTFSQGTVEVAQSRVFTVAGGDILMWSNTGDIDAGKGSKTATSAPPPLVRTDAAGNTVVDLAGVVTGSGIGTLQTVSAAAPGTVYLIAPNGTVNAGDAGIRSSGNLVVAAAHVANADNISVAGVSSGVPAAADTSGLSMGISGATDPASSGRSGDQMAQAQTATQADSNKDSFLPAFVSVEVTGLGNEAQAEKNEKDKRL